MHLLKVVFRYGLTHCNAFFKITTSMISIPTDYLFFNVEMLSEVSTAEFELFIEIVNG